MARRDAAGVRLFTRNGHVLPSAWEALAGGLQECGFTNRCLGALSDGRLPCELHCWSCGTVRRVEPNGDARIVSTERRIEQANAIIEAFRKIS